MNFQKNKLVSIQHPINNNYNKESQKQEGVLPSGLKVVVISENSDRSTLKGLLWGLLATLSLTNHGAICYSATRALPLSLSPVVVGLNTVIYTLFITKCIFNSAWHLRLIGNGITHLRLS